MEAADATCQVHRLRRKLHRRSRTPRNACGAICTGLNRESTCEGWCRHWRPFAQTCQIRRHRKSGIEGRGHLAIISAMKLATLSAMKAATQSELKLATYRRWRRRTCRQRVDDPVGADDGNSVGTEVGDTVVADGGDPVGYEVGDSVGAEGGDLSRN